MTRSARLLLLGTRLAAARWRLAWRRRHGPAGILLGGAGALLAWILLVAGALAFTAVGTTLVAVLARRGDGDLAIAVAGTVADAAAILSVLAVAAAEETHRGIPPRPLLLLPVRAGDRLLAETISLLLAEPLAAVAWPAALVLVLGAGQVAPRAALLLALPAAGLLIFLASLGLAVRRILLAGGRHRPVTAVLATGIVFAAPAAWLLGGWREAANLLRLEGGPWTPGWWIRHACREALAGRGTALLPGGILLLVSFGLLVLAARADERPGPAPPHARGRPPRALPLAAAWWAARPVVAQWTGNGAAALLVLLAAHVLARQGFPWPTLPRAAGALAGLILASAPAPLLANLLGAGGRGPLGLLLAGARPGRLLARLAAAAACPAIILVPVAAAVAAWLLPGTGAGLVLAAVAVGALGLGAGAGFLLSVAWPVRLDPDLPGVSLWPAGPGRWIMVAVQGLALAPFLRGPATAGSLLSVAGGCIAVLAGWHLARRMLRGRVLEVTESLLT